MNKERFLEELRGYLRILEDQEQEDILEEYAQHIDMKLQKGLSEEEAIRDFGPMKDLAAEILEAYHVKPEFDKQKPSSARIPDLKRFKVTGVGAAFRKVGSFLKAKTISCVQGIGKCFRWIGGKFHKLGGWIGTLFAWKKKPTEHGNIVEEQISGLGKNGSGRNEAVEGIRENENLYLEEGQSGRTGQWTTGQGKAYKKEAGSSPWRNFWSCLLRGSKRTWELFVSFCIWCLRLCWNLLWLFMALFFGSFVMIMLAGLGTGIVLLPQGYPVVGILLICLGGILCFGVLCCGSFSLMIRRKKEKQELEPEEPLVSDEDGEEVLPDSAEVE